MLSFAPERLTTLKMQLNLKPGNFKANCPQFVVQSGWENFPFGLLVFSPALFSFNPFMLLLIIFIWISVSFFSKPYPSTPYFAIFICLNFYIVIALLIPVHSHRQTHRLMHTHTYTASSSLVLCCNQFKYHILSLPFSCTDSPLMATSFF